MEFEDMIVVTVYATTKNRLPEA